MTVARGVAAVALTVHGVAHLAVYPVSGDDNADIDASRFWVPMSLARDPAGWAARFLLVVAAVAFAVTAVMLVRSASCRWWIPATGGSVASIAAVALLWNGLSPRPGALWVGPAVSGVVLVITAMVRGRVVFERRGDGHRLGRHRGTLT